MEAVSKSYIFGPSVVFRSHQEQTAGNHSSRRSPGNQGLNDISEPVNSAGIIPQGKKIDKLKISLEKTLKNCRSGVMKGEINA